MAWPTDDLTTTHLDAGTDDPSQARAELKSAVDKLKSVLGEVTAAATVWHSGNDGGGSGLDADTVDTYHASALLDLANATGTLASSKVQVAGLDADTLDGQHGSYYQSATNLTSGTLSMDRIAANAITASKIASGTITTTEIATNTIQQGDIASGAIHQAELDTTSTSVSTDTNSTSDNHNADICQVTPSIGEYGLYPQVRGEATDTTPNISIYYHTGINISTSYTARITLFNDRSGQDRLVYARFRVINASPPYDMGDGEVPLFVFLNYSHTHNKVKGYYVSPTPPWIYEGPTNVTPDRIDKSGGIIRQYKTIREINENTGEFSEHEIEIDTDFKNSDMNVISHPFIADGTNEILLLDSMSTEYLRELHDNEQEIAELIKYDYLRLDNEPLVRAGPQSVRPTRFKWKNTQRRAGEAAQDKRLQQGPYTPPTTNDGS